MCLVAQLIMMYSEDISKEQPQQQHPKLKVLNNHDQRSSARCGLVFSSPNTRSHVVASSKAL